MNSQSNLTSSDPRDRADYGFAHVRDLAFDAVQKLWRRRRREGVKQIDVAKAIRRDPAWVSRKLTAPGNWTLRTLGELSEALGGECEIIVHAMEDPHPVPSNFSAYVNYGQVEEDVARAGGQMVGATMATAWVPRGN